MTKVKNILINTSYDQISVFNYRYGTIITMQPRNAEITIIGGGSIGCAVAYYLAREGYRDLQILERSEIASQTTAQAAGLVGQVRPTKERTLLAMESVKTFSKLYEETGVDPDWRQTGSLRLSLSHSRDKEFIALAEVAASVGLEVEFLDKHRIKDFVPQIGSELITSAIWCPSDGYLQPTSLVNSYLAGAKSLGVSIATNCEVTQIEVKQNTVVALQTNQGKVSTSLVINCAGPWARDIAMMVGVDLPVVPVRHEYFITDTVDGWHPSLPVLRIPDVRLYVRAELDSILCGGWEASAKSLPLNHPTTAFMSPDTDFEVLNQFHTDLARLVPNIDDIGLRSVLKGYPTFTPDGRFIIGPVASPKGFVMAAGCNAHGVSGSAGIAKHLVESLTSSPSAYVLSLTPQRFQNQRTNDNELEQQARSHYENYYSNSLLR